MIWRMPAKTFLIGEYAALAGGPAIVLTTTPNFEIKLSSNIPPFHPDAPAGRLWRERCNFGLDWHDPYLGQGGLGASSAAFLGTYWAMCANDNKPVSLTELLALYHEYSDTGTGMPASGYDVMAQAHEGVVYIHCAHDEIIAYSWPFKDIGFAILRTGNKLATHTHLSQLTTMPALSVLTPSIEKAHHAFVTADSQLLIESITAYQLLLEAHGLMADETREKRLNLLNNPNILAAKGCGAMGADTLLVILPLANFEHEIFTLQNAQWQVIATHLSIR